MMADHALLEVLFPTVRARLLNLFFRKPLKRRHTREVRRLTELALSTVQDELRKLMAVELLTSHSDGYHRFYSANMRHPLFEEVCRIVEISDRFPRAKRSVLHPPRNPRRRRKRPKADTMRNQPPSWGIFSRPSKSTV